MKHSSGYLKDDRPQYFLIAFRTWCKK